MFSLFWVSFEMLVVVLQYMSTYMSDVPECCRDSSVEENNCKVGKIKEEEQILKGFFSNGLIITIHRFKHKPRTRILLGVDFGMVFNLKHCKYAVFFFFL